MNLQGIEVRGLVWMQKKDWESFSRSHSMMQMKDMKAAALQAGAITHSPLFSGALALIDGIIIHLDPLEPDDALASITQLFSRHAEAREDA